MVLPLMPQGVEHFPSVRHGHGGVLVWVWMSRRQKDACPHQYKLPGSTPAFSPPEPQNPTRPLNRRHGRDRGRVEGPKRKAAKVSM